MAVRYVRYDAAADSTNPLTAIGLNPKSATITDVADPDEEALIGGGAILVPKIWEGGGDVSYTMTDLTFLELGLREDLWAELDEFSIGAALDGILHVLQYCKVDQLEISGAVDKTLEITANVKARWKVSGTPGSPTAATGAAIYWTGLAVTVNGNPLRTQDFSIKVNNNLEYDGSLDGGTTGYLRKAERLREGDEKVTISVTTLDPLTDAVRGNMADDPKIDLGFEVTAGNGVSTVTFSAETLMNVGGDLSIPEGLKRAEYKYDFAAPMNSLPLTVS